MDNSINTADIQCRSNIMVDNFASNGEGIDNLLPQNLVNKEKIYWAAGILRSAILAHYSEQHEKSDDMDHVNILNSTRTRKSLNEKKQSNFNIAGSMMVDWLLIQSDCVSSRNQAVGVFQVLLEQGILVIAEECKNKVAYPHTFKDSKKFFYNFLKHEPPKTTVIQHQGLLCLYNNPKQLQEKQLSITSGQNLTDSHRHNTENNKEESQSKKEIDSSNNDIALAHKRFSSSLGHSYWTLIKEKRRSLQKNKTARQPATWTNLRDIVEFYRTKAHTNGSKGNGSNGQLHMDKQNINEAKNANSSVNQSRELLNVKSVDLDVAINILSHISPDALLKMALSKKPEKRTSDDLDLIYQEISHLQALSHLSLMVKRQLVSVIKFECYLNAKGTAIIKQGDVGMSWYVVLKGTLEVIIDGKGCVGTLTEGDDFGKLALINNSPRTASIILSDNNECLLLRVDKTDFDAILKDVEANTMRLNEHGKDVLILEQSLVSEQDKTSDDISLSKLFLFILEDANVNEEKYTGPTSCHTLSKAFWFLQPIIESRLLGLTSKHRRLYQSEKAKNKTNSKDPRIQDKTESNESLAGSFQHVTNLSFISNSTSAHDGHINFKNSHLNPKIRSLDGNIFIEEQNLNTTVPNLNNVNKSNSSMNKTHLKPPVNIMQLGKQFFEKNYLKFGSKLNNNTGMNRSLNSLDYQSDTHPNQNLLSRWSNSGLDCIYENGAIPNWVNTQESKVNNLPVPNGKNVNANIKSTHSQSKFYKYFVVAGTPEKMLEYLLETKLAGLTPIYGPLIPGDQANGLLDNNLLHNCNSTSSSKNSVHLMGTTKNVLYAPATNTIPIGPKVNQKIKQFSLLRSLSLNNKNGKATETNDNEQIIKSKPDMKGQQHSAQDSENRRPSMLPARKDTFIQDFILVYAIFLNSDHLCNLLWKYYNIDASSYSQQAKGRSHSTISKDIIEIGGSMDSFTNIPLKANKLQVIYFIMEWFTLSATLPFIYLKSNKTTYCLTKILEFAENIFKDVEIPNKSFNGDSKHNLFNKTLSSNLTVNSFISEKEFWTYHYVELFLKDFLIKYIKWYKDLCCHINWGPPLTKTITFRPSCSINDEMEARAPKAHFSKFIKQAQDRLYTFLPVPIKLQDKVNLKIYRNNHSHIPYTMTLGINAEIIARDLGQFIWDSIINRAHSPRFLPSKHRIEKSLTLETSIDADDKKARLSLTRKLSSDITYGLLSSLGTIFGGLANPVITCKPVMTKKNVLIKKYDPINDVKQVESDMGQTHGDILKFDGQQREGEIVSGTLSSDISSKNVLGHTKNYTLPRDNISKRRVDNYKLVEVKSNGSTVILENGDINFVSRLLCNSRLFVAEIGDIDKLKPLTEQLGPMTGTFDALDNMNTKELALYITRHDWTLFKCIIPAELYGRTIPMLKNKLLTFNLDLFLTQFVIIQHWVCTELCLIPINNMGKRVQLLKKFIKLAFYCKELQNLNTFFAILMGLNDICVSRLVNTWEKIPAKLKKVYEDLVLLTDPSRNHRAYRLCLTNMNPPIIPFMPVIMKDMTFIHEGNKTYTETELVNFEKMHLIADILRNFNYYQSKEFDIEYYSHFLGCRLNNGIASPFRMSKIIHSGFGPDEYDAYITNLHVIDDHKVLMELSYKIEPRKK